MDERAPASVRLEDALREIETLRRAALNVIATQTQSAPSSTQQPPPPPQQQYEWGEHPGQTYADLVAELADGKCNSSVLSAHVEAIKAAQGPAVSEVRSAKDALELVKSSVEQIQMNSDVQYKTRVEHKMGKLEVWARESAENAARAATRYEAARRQVMHRAADRAFTNRQKYDAIFSSLEHESVVRVADLAAALASAANVSNREVTDGDACVVSGGVSQLFRPNQIVLFDDRASNRLIRAKVVRQIEDCLTTRRKRSDVSSDAGSDDYDWPQPPSPTYNQSTAPQVRWLIALEKEVLYIGHEYSVAFSDKVDALQQHLQPEHVLLQQPMNGVPADTSSLEYLVHLMADSEAATAPFTLACKSIVARATVALGAPHNDSSSSSICSGTVGLQNSETATATATAGATAGAAVTAHFCPLKKLSRVTQKTQEKYGGNYGKVCDILRMTFACESIEALLATLEAVRCEPMFKVVRVKNRLHPAFNPAETMGYRDVLINVELVGAKGKQIYAEVQITLSQLLEVKQSGGHGDYRLVRLVGGMEAASTTVSSSLSEVNLWRIKAGMISVVNIECSFIDWKMDNLHISEALASNDCHLKEFRFAGSSGLSGERLDAILTHSVLSQLAHSLEVLNGGGCGLTGEIPAELWTACSKLKEITLSRNNLGGHILSPGSTIACALTLQQLNLHENMFSHVFPPELCMCQALVQLDLSDNRLEGTIPTDIGKLAALTHLNLYVNRLSGEIPASLGNARLLQELDLSQNELTGNIPESLGKCVELKEVRINTNRLNGWIPKSFGNLLHLRKLSLRDNKLDGSIPHELGCCARMEKLFLYGNEFTGPLPSELGNCTRLQKLYLNGNKLSGVIPELFALLSRLTGLRLQKNMFEGSLPESLGMCSQLEELSLAKNMLTGSIPGVMLGKLARLSKLSLSDNLLVGPLPAELLKGCTKLKIVALQGNQLGGKIPIEVGMCAYLEELDLSCNSFSGGIPTEIGMCTKLTDLNLGSNELAGQIPQEIGLCVKLEEISLANNCLSGGGVPEELSRCRMLRSLNLEFNEAEFVVPDQVERLRHLVYLKDSVGGQSRQRASRGSGIIPRTMRALRAVRSFSELRKDSSAKAT